MIAIQFQSKTLIADPFNQVTSWRFNQSDKCSFLKPDSLLIKNERWNIPHTVLPCSVSTHTINTPYIKNWMRISWEKWVNCAKKYRDYKEKNGSNQESRIARDFFVWWLHLWSANKVMLLHSMLTSPDLKLAKNQLTFYSPAADELLYMRSLAEVKEVHIFICINMSLCLIKHFIAKLTHTTAAWQAKYQHNLCLQ